MKQDNRGLSLIELVITIAVSVIIMGTVTLFISNALRSYNAATSTIDLQMESQVIMEQLSSWIMEGNYVTVKPITVTDSHGNTLQVDALWIYHLPRLVPSDRLPLGVKQDTYSNRRVIWMQNGRLFMDLYEMGVPEDEEYSGEGGDPEESGTPEEGGNTEDELEVLNPTTDTIAPDYLKANDAHCICEYMEIFLPTWNEETNTVSIEVILKANGQEYELENEFKVRNEIL